MNAKTTCISGFILLIASQAIFLQGQAFMFAQEPIDFAHWFMMIGAFCMLGFYFLFPEGMFHKIASICLAIGVMAHVGMASLDILFWSYGPDDELRNAVLRQTFQTKSLALPFFSIGPAMLFVGLTTYLIPHIKPIPVWTLMAFVGSFMVGIGQLITNDRLLVLAGTIVLAIGMITTVYRIEKPVVQASISLAE